MAEPDEPVVPELTDAEIEAALQEIIDITNHRCPVISPKGFRLEWPANDWPLSPEREKGPAPA